MAISMIHLTKMKIVALLVLLLVRCAVVSSTEVMVIKTIAGTGIGDYSGDGGAATSAELYQPRGVAVDASSGNVLISDSVNCRIRMVDQSGIITTVAGTGTYGFSGDNGTATSAKLSPELIAVDESGNVYIADGENHRIRKVTVSNGIITTIAGNSTDTDEYGGDNGPATSATFDYPVGVAVDASGNVYIADYSNQRIRKVTVSNGIITTIAGTGPVSGGDDDTGGYSGDGGAATSATLNGPSGVAVDASGNVHIADFDNNRIRKVTVSNGIITTIAGTGYGGYAGDGGAATSATLNGPDGVALDASGNVYIADQQNHRIRKVTASNGIITTIAGAGSVGYSGDNGAATSATLYWPSGVALDAAGNVYIADYGNNVVRVVYSVDLDAYSQSVLNCVSDHHHGYEINEYLIYDMNKCVPCPTLKVSYLREPSHDECTANNFLDQKYDKCTLFNCFDGDSNGYLNVEEGMLYGMVVTNIQLVVVLLLLCLLSLGALLLVRDLWLSVGILAYLSLPFMDFITDLTYLLTQPFYHWVALALCFTLVIIPWIHFAYHLVQVKADPKMRLIAMPKVLFFAEYNNIFKVAYTGLGYLVFSTLNGNIVLFLLGGFLYATKLFTITAVSNMWFYYWLGDNRLANSDVVLDGAELNSLLFLELLLESLPQFTLQLTNAIYLSNLNVQNFTDTSIVSITVSIISMVHTLYRIIYIKFYLGRRLDSIPVDLTLEGWIPANASHKTVGDVNISSVDVNRIGNGRYEQNSNSDFLEMTTIGGGCKDFSAVNKALLSLNKALLSQDKRLSQLEEANRLLPSNNNNTQANPLVRVLSAMTRKSP